MEVSDSSEDGIGATDDEHEWGECGCSDVSLREGMFGVSEAGGDVN